MADFLISTLLQDFSIVMLVAAALLAIASSRRRAGRAGGGFANQLLGWLLLLSVGAQGVYTFIMHVFFSSYSAANIGWAVSPFQYEVGIADLTVGVLGVLAFWGNFSFRLAAAIAAIVWYWGDAVGHVRQMMVAHNFAPGNAGPWFWTDVIVPALLVICLIAVWKQEQQKETST
jgi:Family of unknown function (DUF6790)